jgi:prepilin-type N-terminal cleavage/methylation domain-containing protein
MALNNIKRNSGFTIVELLIVIVVIAILATISIVAYTGIQNRAKTSAGQTLASQVAKKIEAYYAVNSTYPILRSAIQGTNESKIDGLASGTTADTVPIIVGATDSLLSATTLDGTTGNGGQSVRINGTATSGDVFYWDYTGTPAEKSIHYGP